MRCPKYGSDNREGHKFCGDRGGHVSASHERGGPHRGRARSCTDDAHPVAARAHQRLPAGRCSKATLPTRWRGSRTRLKMR